MISADCSRFESRKPAPVIDEARFDRELRAAVQSAAQPEVWIRSPRPGGDPGDQREPEAPGGVANLALIFANRSWSRTMLATLRSPNAALWWVLGGAVTFLGLVLYFPWLRALFLFATLHPIDLAIALAAGSLSVLWFELVKEVNFRRGRSIAGP